MKQKILIKRLKDVTMPKVLAKGDWIDLRAAETVSFKAPQAQSRKAKTVEGEKTYYRNVYFDLKLIPLGVAILLPNGMEAHVVPRSSTASGMGIIQANSKGIIDGGPLGYNGPTDEWKFPAVALRDTVINAGERICQFRITLSQKATVWQKIKWLLSDGIELVEVDDLPAKADRGGFGTTGKA